MRRIGIRAKLALLTMVASICAGAIVWSYDRHQYYAAPHIVLVHTTADTGVSPTRIMIVGGSVARGWKDKHGGGYLERALSAMPSSHPYLIMNDSVAGDGPVAYANLYQSKLKTSSPTVVVVSWGTLDDLSGHTPVEAFDNAVKKEIDDALSQGSVVLVVTPPVTSASFTGYKSKEPTYVDAEIQTADAFKSKNVFVFDLFHQMLRYIQRKHIDYKTLMADGWHPNAAGHALAGKLLAADLEAKFPNGLAPAQAELDVSGKSKHQQGLT